MTEPAGLIETSEGDYQLQPTPTWCELCGYRWTFTPWLHAYGFKVVEFDARRYIQLVRALIFCPQCDRDTWHNTKKPSRRPRPADK